MVCLYDGKVDWWSLNDDVRARLNERDTIDTALTLLGLRYGYMRSIVLGLRKHIGGDDPGISTGGNDKNFGRAGEEIDADPAFLRDDLLGRCDVRIAGTDDTVYGHDCGRAVCKSSDRMSPSHTEEFANAKQMGAGKDLGRGFGRNDADTRDAGHLGEHCGHEQR